MFYPPWLEFDVGEWLVRRVEFLFGATPVEQVLLTPALRRELCLDDPLLFGWVYLSRHLMMPDGRITFAQPHLEWYELARDWMHNRDGGIAEWRHVFIAPRSCAKSTIWFLLVPMWALAYGHARFVAAFANQTGQAEGHLSTFKRESDTNALLRSDFPELCTPALRPARGTQVADRQGMLHARSGAVFAAKGVDSASLGMKVENRRPDVIVLDDLEPDEARYSAVLAEKRRGTLIDAILPLSVSARVAMVGTVTMPNSITHQAVRSLIAGDESDLEWVAAERFTVHHHSPFVVDEDGVEHSIWPEKWPTEWLQARRHTREFAKNYLNDPLARDGDYWTSDDFRYDPPPAVTRRLLSIDPAVTKKATSDFTGLAVIGYDPTAGRCSVEFTAAVKLAPGALRARVLAILTDHPTIKVVYIECNQGGDAWAEILAPMPPGVKLISVHQSEPKEVRAARCLDHYQAGLVAHDGPQPVFEAQAVVFPCGAHDDVVDAVSAGVQFFLKDRKRVKHRPSTHAYA